MKKRILVLLPVVFVAGWIVGGFGVSADKAPEAGRIEFLTPLNEDTVVGTRFPVVLEARGWQPERELAIVVQIMDLHTGEFDYMEIVVETLPAFTGSTHQDL